MEHPCYTSMNPVAEAQRYTPEKVQVRKVTLIYDWLDPDRDVKSWFRMVPYRLEKGPKGRSWVVRYFEFRAKTSPVPQMGFIGDLWICWDANDPSVWFKVDETAWERWGGCASSVRDQMNAKHPFLDKTYLWFDPIDHFFPHDKQSDSRLSLRWERLPKIRKVAPPTRIVGPDCDTRPKKALLNPVRLPDMRTIVGAMCRNMPRPALAQRSAQITYDVDCGEGSSRAVASGPSRVQAGGLRGPFQSEDVGIGNDVEIDWDWWGSTDDEANDEATQVGTSQPPHLSPTPTPPPVAPAERSRYHPYRLNIPPRAPFTKFKPPRRYTQGVLDPSTSLGTPCNTPMSSVSSTTSSTVVSSTANLTAPINDRSPATGLQERELLIQAVNRYLHRPSHWILRDIVTILREDNYDQSGTCALIPPEVDDVVEDLASELPVHTLHLGTRTSHKIRELLRLDGFTKPGIIILKIRNS